MAQIFTIAMGIILAVLILSHFEIFLAIAWYLLVSAIVAISIGLVAFPVFEAKDTLTNFLLVAGIALLWLPILTMAIGFSNDIRKNGIFTKTSNSAWKLISQGPLIIAIRWSI